MIIIFGTLRNNPKRVAVRRDYCNVCSKECLAEQWRTDDVGHILFIPLFPKGAMYRWVCPECGNDPREYYTERQWLLAMGIPSFALFSVIGFAAIPSARDENEKLTMVGMGIVTGLLAMLCLYLFFHRDDSQRQVNLERRKEVPPLNPLRCPYCGGPLVAQPELHCPACQVRVHTSG